MVATRSGVRTKPAVESRTMTEKVVESEPLAQKKAPVKRAKDAKPSKAVTEKKKADIVAEHDAPVRKSTRVRRPAITEDFEQPKSPRHAQAAKKDELAQAASIPLPEESQDQHEDADADLHAKPSKLVTRSHRGGHAGQEPAAAPAEAPASKARRSRAQLAGFLKALPWKWIALALCLAAVAGAGYHYRQPLTERAHELDMHMRSQLASAKAYVKGPLPKKISAWEHSLRESLRSYREDFLDGWFAIRQHAKGAWRSLVKRLHTEKEHVKPCSAQLDGAALEAILAQEPAWEGLRGSAQDVWAGHKEDPHKGMGMLMVGRTEAAASAATLALQKALPASCRSCFLAFKAGQAAHASPDAAGAVQKELAGFLKGCPGGVVVLDNAQKLQPSLLPVFINALSEQGSFEVDGKSVPAHKALYVATVQDSSDTLDQHDEASFKRKAKKSFAASLTEHVPALLAPMTTSHAEALRRRLEVVVPLKD